MPTVRRQADEIIRLKEAGVRPSEIAIRVLVGRVSIGSSMSGMRGVACAA